MLMEQIGALEALDKAVFPQEVITWLGIEIDTIAMVIRVPPEKLRELLELLVDWSDKTRVTRKDLEKLIGKLAFAAKAVRAGRLFYSRLIHAMKKMKKVGTYTLDEQARKDIMWWCHFLPSYNWVSMLPKLHWEKVDSVFSTDSCLGGYGGWKEQEYFWGAFPAQVTDTSPDINQLELLVIILALKVWFSELRGHRIQVYCDNQASCQVINEGRPRDPALQQYLREICFLGATGGFEVRAVHLSSQENRISDLLSRSYSSAACRQEFSSIAKQRGMKEVKVQASMFNMSHDW